MNAFVPGSFPSELGSQPSADREAGIASHVPIGREGAPAECASAVVFRASGAASYITGAVLEVDGALLARRLSVAV